MTRRSYHALAACAVALLGPSRADAHSGGLSRSDFTLEGTTVHAALDLARADASVLLRGPDETLAARDLVEAGIDVRADGERCPPSLERAAPFAGDGYELRVSFACPRPPASLSVALPLLDELPPGHLHALRLRAGDRTVDAALRSGAQVATVDAPGAPRGPSRVTLALGAAVAALAAALFLRRIVTRP